MCLLRRVLDMDKCLSQVEDDLLRYVWIGVHGMPGLHPLSVQSKVSAGS